MSRGARHVGVLLVALTLCLLPTERRGEAGERGDDPGPMLERLDIRDLPLAEACRLLSDETGINLVPSAEAGKQAITLFLQRVPVRTAVETLCRANGLWYRMDAATGIVRISTVSEYKRDLSGLSEETSEYFTLLYPNAVEVGYAIRNLFGDRVVLGFGEADEDLLDDLENRFDRFDVVDERTQGFGTGINALGAYGGSSSYGNGYGYGNNVTATGYGSNGYRSAFGSGRTQRVSRSRRDYDDGGGYDRRQGRYGPSDGASVEITPEEITELERSAYGEGVGAGSGRDLRDTLARRARVPIRVTVLRRQNRIAVRTADEPALDAIRTLVRRLDVPTATVLLEVRILSIDLSDGAEAFFDYQFGGRNVAGGFTQGSIRQPPGQRLDLGGTGVRGGDFAFQVVNDNFAMRLQALESKNKVCALATPLLLTANNEVSRLFIGREVPLNRSFVAGQTVANDNTTTVVPGSTGIEFRPVGTTLLITPTIHADRTVTLRIVQETSDVDSTASVLVPTGTGFVPQNVGVVSSQTVSGTIVAKSELAVAFGGMIETASVNDRSQVPLLGDMPLLGVLFRRAEVRETRREVVILVRPFVLNTPAESEAISHDLLQRLGVDTDRAGTAPGRDRSLPYGPRAGAASRLPFRIHGLDGGIAR